MKSNTLFLLFLVLFADVPLSAQTKWVIPSQPGDVMILEVRDRSNRTWEITQTYGYQFDTFKAVKVLLPEDKNHDNDTCVLYSVDRELEKHCGGAMVQRLTPRGVVEHVYGDISEFDIFHKVEYYPASPPQNDTLTLNNSIRYWRNGPDSMLAPSISRTIRRFDSALFGVQTQCFIAAIQRPTSNDTFTIANGFGLIRATVDEINGNHYDAFLKCAVISGKRYNWHTRNINIFPLCKGDVRQYTYSNYEIPGPQNNGWYNLFTNEDTVINGNLYHKTIIKRFYSEPQFRFVRNTPAGTMAWIEGYGDILIFPSYLVPRMVIDNVLYYDTTTRSIYGKSVLSGGRIIRYSAFGSCGPTGSDAEEYDSWADSIGFVSWDYRGNFGERGKGNLQYASICGTEINTPLGTGHRTDPSITSNALNQNYPNPVSQNSSLTVIPFRLDGAKPTYVLLTVSDFLGRKIAVLVDGLIEPGPHEAQFRTSLLPPGIYCYTLWMNGRTETRKLSVTK